MSTQAARRPRLSATLNATRGSCHLSATFAVDDRSLAIIGPNGSGKTTLLLAILGALPVVNGRLVLGEDVLCDTAGRIDAPVEERRLAYVPQDSGLLPHLSAARNVEFALACRRAPACRRRQESLALLRSLGVESVADRTASALSSGEKQRVALARALASSPRALLLDEPTAALDVAARREVRGVLARVLDERRLPAIVVTHDADDIFALAGCVAVMEQGRMVACGRCEELQRAPPTQFAADFFAKRHCTTPFDQVFS